MLSLTSMPFFLLFLLSVGIYYLIPKRFQWCALLVYSVCFFCASSTLHTGIYLLICILVTSVCVRIIYQKPDSGKIPLILGILVNVSMLAVLKYCNFFVSNFYAVKGLLQGSSAIESAEAAPVVSFLVPIGISFYTFQAIAYLLDTYWGITEPQTNLLKSALFIGYWPQLTSGPIARHNDVRESLFAAHEFDWEQVTFGLQRMLWGYFKKLVISARLELVVYWIFLNTEYYHGLYVWIGMLLFMLQLYTDFSGCMDIIIGASECYGVQLPENFRTPFFARSVQEYWQRWHITLGLWMKDYIMYPVLRTKGMQRFAKWLKKHVGKRAAKQIPSYLAMAVVWLLIGLWHGGEWKYVIGEGGWFWLCIVLAQVLEPLYKKLIAFFHINTRTFSWHVFQSIRVYILVAIGNLFFRLDSIREVFHSIRMGFTGWNPWILFDGSLFQLEVTEREWKVVALGVLALIIVSALQETKGSVRRLIAGQNVIFRWLIWIALIWSIAVMGVYGPGFNAASFIYQQF